MKVKSTKDAESDGGVIIDVFRKKIAGSSRKYVKVKWNKPIRQDKKGNDIFIEEKPITEINAYLKSLAEWF